MPAASGLWHQKVSNTRCAHKSSRVLPTCRAIEGAKALAQASGVLGFVSMNKTPEEGSMYYFVGADKLRFKNPVIPGDKLTLESTKISEKAGIWKFDCKATVGEKFICSAIVLCADRPK